MTCTTCAIRKFFLVSSKPTRRLLRVTCPRVYTGHVVISCRGVDPAAYFSEHQSPTAHAGFAEVNDLETPISLVQFCRFCGKPRSLAVDCVDFRR